MSDVVRCRSWTLDVGARRLARGEVDVHLTPKAFDLLVLLLREAPRVVPKEELHLRLWPDSHVADVTLSGMVKELRRAIDDGGEPSLIRTAHRVGHAFTGALEPGPAVPSVKDAHWLVLEGLRVALREGENLVGRDPSAAVWLNYAGVSRRHARILVRDGSAIVEDLASKNGTRVREERAIGLVALTDGDRVAFGPVAALYRCSTGMTTDTQIGHSTL
jgi:DNA-binding winged helix-turn-helix (wHTH) protein